MHRVHSVMALRDYVIAHISRRFASLVILRASEMHGMRVGEFACIGDGSAWSAWLDVEYRRTVAYDYARLRVRGGGGWGGGFVGVVASRAVLGSCIALRASAVAASLRWVWRVRADEASVMCALVGVRVLPLRWVWIPCDYARLRVRGGVGRVVSFASLRVVSSRSSVSLLCVHVRGRVDARLRLLRLRDSWVSLVSLVSLHVHVCMFAVR